MKHNHKKRKSTEDLLRDLIEEVKTLQRQIGGIGLMAMRAVEAWIRMEESRKK